MIPDEVTRLYWTTGQAAQRLGTTAAVIRFYETTLDLKVKKVTRGATSFGNKRKFTREDIDVLGWILRASRYLHLQVVKELLQRDCLAVTVVELEHRLQ
jgi:DNA-binding transcriptional MerR regulator